MSGSATAASDVLRALGRALKNAIASPTVALDTSAMCLLLIVTPSASFFSRSPRQPGQRRTTIYFSISALVHSESVSFQRLFKFGTTPSNFPLPSSSGSIGSPGKTKFIKGVGKSANGLFNENLKRAEISSSIHQYHVWRPTRCEACDQGAIAHSAKVSLGLGNTSFSSTSSVEPSPVHTRQAPKGLLNEKVRGSISAKLMPQS